MNKDLFLVIDMQNVYDKGGQWCCQHTETAAANIKKILERESPDLDVIFTMFLAAKDPVGIWKQYNLENREVNEDDFANEMIGSLKNDAKKYPVYVKSTYSSLSIPEVLDAAKKAGRVVVSGGVAECCVLSTVMALIDEGVKVIYLTDAVAGIDEQTEHAAELILQGLSPLHVELMTTQSYLTQLAQLP